MANESFGAKLARLRKEHDYTQNDIADKVGVTAQAVSKWENGKSLPDASIMLELCKLLEIDVNELLTGEHITMENYKDKAEENLLEMRTTVEKRNKLLLQVDIAMCVAGVMLMVLLSLVGSYLCEHGMLVIGYILMFSQFILVIPMLYFSIKIEHDAGYYECPNCGERYVPTMKETIFAPHMGWNKKLKCPYCGKKGYHKKVISKTKGGN